MISRRFPFSAARPGTLAIAAWVVLVLVSGLACPARAAIRYVDAASAGGDGASWATAFTTVQQGVNAAQSGDMVEVAGGVYAEALSSVRSGVTVAGSTAPGRNGTVTIKGPADAAVLIVRHQTTWRRITFDGSANTDRGLAVVKITAGSPAFEQCVVGPGQRLLDIGTGGATFSRCTIQEARQGDRVYTAVIDIHAGDSGAVAFEYCLLGDMEYGYIQVRNAARVDCNNCLLAGFSGDVLYVPSTATVPGGVHWKNCLAMANGYAATAIIENLSSSVAVTLTNCLVQPKSPVEMDQPRFVGPVDEVHPLVPGSPGLVHGRRPALVNLGIDDAVNIPFWTQVAAVCDGYGLKSTLAVDAADADGADWAMLQPRVDAGHEVAAHSARHVYLPEKRLLTLGYAGPGTGATVTVAGVGTAAASLSVTVAGDPAANFSLDLTAPDYDTLGKVRAAIAARPGFTCAVIAIPGTSYTSARVLSRDLDAAADVDIQNVTATLFRNDAQFFADEIVAPKAIIESRLTAPGSAAPYACASFVYPFLDTDASVLAAVEGAGYAAARTGYYGSYAMGGYYAAGQPGGYNTLAIWAVKPGDVFGRHPDPQTLRIRVAAVLAWAQFTGAAISLFSHGEGEYSLAEWTALIGLLAEDPQVNIATLGQIAQYVAANAQSRSGTTYIRTVWPEMADYAPLSGSPLIAAGAAYDVPMTDFGGGIVPAGALPSVGLYQRAPAATPAALPATLRLLLQTP